MRLWSLHPKYLDAKGLVAPWREALLAQAVLRAQTRGYRHHRQLEGFRTHVAPLSAVNTYLGTLYAEAQLRSYSFDKTKIGSVRRRLPIRVSSGQLRYEWAHLLAKVRRRAPALQRRWHPITVPQAHPLFACATETLRPGNV